MHVNGAFMKAKRHFVTRNQLSDWPAVIYFRSFVYMRFPLTIQEDIVSFPLNESACCGLSDTSLRDVDSDRVFLAV